MTFDGDILGLYAERDAGNDETLFVENDTMYKDSGKSTLDCAEQARWCETDIS